MALDNAEFIAELSILDPPGTDPLNQGDDHIRTTKKAVQQSFPNIDAAVPQTAAQMGQMAIKNEANTFTQINLFQQQQQGGNGSALAPLWSFQNSPNMGFFRNASAQLGVAFGGVQVATFASTNFDTTLNRRGPDGTALLPAFAFTAQGGTGMYRPGTSLGFAVSGADVLFILPNQMRSVVTGSTTLPAWSFQADTGMGMFRGGAGLLDFSVSGVRRFRVSAAEIIGTTVDMQLSDNNVPATIDSVVTRGSSFTFDNIIGFAKETFYQDLITFNDLADNRPKVRWRTLSSDRWSLGGTGLDMTTFTLTRFNNLGAFVDIPMEVNQSDGQITFENRFKCNGRAIELRSADTATASTFQWKPGGILFMELASGTIASPLMSFVRYSNTGGFLGLPLQINRLTGGIVLPELPTSSAGLPSGGLFKSGGFVAIV